MSLWWLLVVACIATPFILEIVTTTDDEVTDRLKAEASSRALSKSLISDHDRVAVKSVREKCRTANDLVSRRFGKTEITAARYRMGIEEVRLGFLSNLTKQKSLRDTVAHLDRAAIEAEIKQLDVVADDEMIAVLQKRLEILASVEEKVLSLQASNEQAINALDKSIISLSALPIGEAAQHSDLENVVGELELLVSRAHRLALDEASAVGQGKRKHARESGRKMITPGGS